MRCGKCGKDIKAGVSQCPYCQAPVHYGGNTKFYNQAAQNKVNITDFFSNIFSSQPADAGDRMFVSGTAMTTPTPDRMLQEWNKPWLYARFLLLGLIFCLLCYFMFAAKNHPGGIITLFSLGSMVVPLSVLIFYWEINIPRDIPFYRVLLVFFIGGMLSIIFALFLPSGFTYDGTNPYSVAPLTEEPAKLLVLAIFIYVFDIRYIFGGLLIGAAVGAGFSAFEDIYYVMGKSSGLEDALSTFVIRSIMTLGGHVTWAAMEGGALAMAKGSEPFNVAHLVSPKFLFYFAAAMFLHFSWDGGLFEGMGPIPLVTLSSENSAYAFFFVLTLAAILLAFTLIRQAVFQVLDVVNTATAQSPVSSPATYANTPMLLATNGPLANALFPLEQRITFGRDPALCNIVFPSGTPGVSRRHCVLEPHSDGIYLMDLDSSSGTFLQNGQRLNPNQWVKITGNFCLGSPNVMFAIQKSGQAPMPQQIISPPQPINPPQPPPQIIPPPQPINPPQPVMANVTIIGIVGPAQGKTFSDSQRLIIGREPSQCNVVLPPRTPGVSRRHCVLERRANGVYIMDVGSSAGTFLQNGQRLTPNQWVPITGNFYLGSPNVMFSVN